MHVPEVKHRKMCEQVMIGFGFTCTSDWVKEWAVFLSQLCSIEMQNQLLWQSNEDCSMTICLVPWAFFDSMARTWQLIHALALMLSRKWDIWKAQNKAHKSCLSYGGVQLYCSFLSFLQSSHQCIVTLRCTAKAWVDCLIILPMKMVFSHEAKLTLRTPWVCVSELWCTPRATEFDSMALLH